MENTSNLPIRSILDEKRAKLKSALKTASGDLQLQQLLDEVDEAVDRLNKGSYGLCKVCHEEIEPDCLIADPLLEYCLEHMTPVQRHALEEDLHLTSKIQKELLPQKKWQEMGWEAEYVYEGLGPVSGDYCDIVSSGGNLFFTIGDVSGKGISASLLMSHLHATFKTLISLDLPLNEILERMSRIFCKSTGPTHFATLVSCKAGQTGEIEICNAGHLPPIIIQGENLNLIEATGIPLGMFCDEHFFIDHVHLKPGDTLFMYTDGLSEARNQSGKEYGLDRLSKILQEHQSLSPGQLISKVLEDLNLFQSGTAKTDDLTLMAVKRL